jgi:cell wall-associated NlpC family hydrolase
MTIDFSKLIEKLAEGRSDERLNVFSINSKVINENTVVLTGRVLEQKDIEALIETLTKANSSLLVDVSAVDVLRKPTNLIQMVATNLSSGHASTSFLSEMSSQMVFGTQVEILAEEDRWVFTRQVDGYLSWTYKPYLTDVQLSPATHIVLKPAITLHEALSKTSPIITRIFCGTYVKVEQTNGEWALISANKPGWTKLENLRALADLPQTADHRRAQICEDAQRMIGVPYLWGGTSGNGIDCSAFARLLHRWVGIELPRDADMQSAQCKRVEAPFQPGDLLFFGEDGGKRRISHVGVSMGGWQILHSSRSRNGVYPDDIQENEYLRSIFAFGGTFL